MILFFTMVFILSCKNDQQDKQVADSVKTLVGNGVDTTKRLDSSGFKKDNSSANASLKPINKDSLSTASK